MAKNFSQNAFQQPEKLLKLPKVLDLTATSKATWYDKMKRGLAPLPIPQGARARAWRASDIQRWIENPIGWKSEAQVERGE